jgi:uncharacterized protein (TIGR02246 family)
MNDEQKIRELILAWLDATKAGDVSRLGSLMAEDVVFLTPGQQPMRGRGAFETSFLSVIKNVRIEATSDVQEIEVAGEWAYCWNHLTVTAMPLKPGPPMLRTGFTLTILRRNAEGNWVISRDANLLTTVAAPAPQ